MTESAPAKTLTALDTGSAQGLDAVHAAIVASALDCIVVIDEDGAILEFNPAAERTFGHVRANVLGQSLGGLIVPPAHRQAHADGLARLKANGQPRILGQRIEIEAMRANGDIFPVELTVSEVRLPDRRLFTASLRDLTPAKEAAAEIRRQRDALHQSEKMAAFGSLLAGVAHELNNPLSIVIGNALMLADEAEDNAPALATRAKRIQAAGERCGRIVRTFLAMARQSRTQMKPARVESLIDSALQLLSYGLRTSGVEVSVDVRPGLPAPHCDADQIHQVLTNILVNARQVLEAQPQPRRVSISARPSGGDAVEIAISDNGPGIPDEIKTRVFDPFFTTKPAGAGTGIGLAVSRGIVEAHGGTLTLGQSDSGGARFVLHLPIQPDDAAADEIATAPEAKPPERVRPKILIVDDEEDVGGTLAEMLTAMGFACDVANGGEAGLDYLREKTPTAILCDMRMPGVDGPAVFAWLSKHKPDLKERIAFVTGDTLGHASATFLAASGRPVLEKPFLPAELRRMMNDLIPAGTG